MYHASIARLSVALRNMEVWLDRSEAYAKAKDFDVQVLMNARLAPDMGDFVYQVQSACDYTKGGAAWLSGGKPPRHEDNERTIGEVRERIRKTVAFVDGIAPDAFEGAADRKVGVSWSPKGTMIDAEEYLLQVCIPNVYFHVMAAYAILRHNGVDVGKMEFLGPIDWVEA